MSYQKNADGRRAMQKAPSRMTGPFGRSSVGRECSLTPPISQFVTLPFGSKGRPSPPCERGVGHPAHASHRRKLWHQLRPSKLTKWAAAAASHTWAGLQLVEVKLTARVRANP